MNLCIFKGRLVKDPAIYHSEKIDSARFTLAVNDRNDTAYVDCVIFGKRVDAAEKYLKKGTLIEIRSKLRDTKWTDKNNVTRYSKEFIVEDYEFCESRAAQQKHEELHAQQAEEKKMEDFVNDIPSVDEVPFS